MRLMKETRNEFRKMVVQIPDAHSIVRDNALALLDECDALESELAVEKKVVAHLGQATSSLLKRAETAESNLAESQAALERDRTKVAECVTAIQKELHSYDWLISSRGSYEWDDDRWHGEFKTATTQYWKPFHRW